jgi:ketosteroid isomerase-like protein
MNTTTTVFEPFFARYAELLSRFDAEAIADLYDYPCLMVSDAGVAVGMERAHAVDGVRGMAALYGPTGFRRAAPRVESAELLSDRLALVRVHWTYLAEADRPIYENRYVYLVRRADGGEWRVCVAASIDDAERLEALLGGSGGG